MESATRQEDKGNAKIQQPRMTVQQSSDTVQHETTARYVTGYLNQQPGVYLATPYFLDGSHMLPYQPTSSCYWSLCPIVFAGSYHVMN